jgi:hypothetical protein
MCRCSGAPVFFSSHLRAMWNPVSVTAARQCPLQLRVVGREGRRRGGVVCGGLERVVSDWRSEHTESLPQCPAHLLTLGRGKMSQKSSGEPRMLVKIPRKRAAKEQRMLWIWSPEGNKGALFTLPGNVPQVRACPHTKL